MEFLMCFISHLGWLVKICDSAIIGMSQKHSSDLCQNTAETTYDRGENRCLIMKDSNRQSPEISFAYPIGSMYAIYIIWLAYTINIPQMLAYIPAPWILWVWEWPNTKQSSSDATAILVSRMLVGIHHRQQNHVVVPWSNCPCLKRRYTLW